MWEHIPSLQKAHNYKIKDYLRESEELLSRSVSLPIFVNQDKDLGEKIRKVLL